MLAAFGQAVSITGQLRQQQDEEQHQDLPVGHPRAFLDVGGEPRHLLVWCFLILLLEQVSFIVLCDGQPHGRHSGQPQTRQNPLALVSPLAHLKD